MPLKSNQPIQFEEIHESFEKKSIDIVREWYSILMKSWNIIQPQIYSFLTVSIYTNMNKEREQSSNLNKTRKNIILRMFLDELGIYSTQPSLFQLLFFVLLWEFNYFRPHFYYRYLSEILEKTLRESSKRVKCWINVIETFESHSQNFLTSLQNFKFPFFLSRPCFQQPDAMSHSEKFLHISIIAINYISRRLLRQRLKEQAKKRGPSGKIYGEKINQWTIKKRFNQISISKFHNFMLHWEFVILLLQCFLFFHQSKVHFILVSFTFCCLSDSYTLPPFAMDLLSSREQFGIQHLGLEIDVIVD